jgi:hypothetical protein
MDLKQPFSLLDIKKYPVQILIACLIGAILYFNEQRTIAETEVQRLNARIDTINTERLRLYDQVIFQDVLLKKLKQDTEQPVKRILKTEESQ